MYAYIWYVGWTYHIRTTNANTRTHTSTVNSLNLETTTETMTYVKSTNKLFGEVFSLEVTLQRAKMFLVTRQVRGELDQPETSVKFGQLKALS